MTTTSRNRKSLAISREKTHLRVGCDFGRGARARSHGLRQRICADAPAPKSAATTEDMRLWSFGDCDRRFPYVATSEHKECVRVVGSPEAVEARALRVCDVSHAADKEEAERCKATYKSNKARAAADGVVADAPATPQAPPSEEVMRQGVKAITTAAVEAERAATKAGKPAAAEEEEEFVPQPEESSWKSTLMMVVLLAVGVGLGRFHRLARPGERADGIECSPHESLLPHANARRVDERICIAGNACDG